MSKPVISVIIPAIRPHLWNEMLDSLEDNNVPFEVILLAIEKPIYPLQDFVRHIKTNVNFTTKMALGFHLAKGQYVNWVADDQVYSPHALDKIVELMNKLSWRDIVQARYFEEDDENPDVLYDKTYIHRLYEKPNFPMMAFAATITKDLYNFIGGFDNRFLGTGSENDLVLRAYNKGSQLFICHDAIIYGAHKRKHGAPGERTLKSTDAQGRRLFESLWIDEDCLFRERRVSVEPFLTKDLEEICRQSELLCPSSLGQAAISQ